MWQIKFVIMCQTVFTFIAPAKILPSREIEKLIRRLEKLDKQLCKRLIFPTYNDRYHLYDELVEYRKGIEKFYDQMRQDTPPDILELGRPICDHNGPNFMQLYLDCNEFNSTYRFIDGELIEVSNQLNAVGDAWKYMRIQLCPTDDDRELYEDPPLQFTNATLEYGPH